MRTAPAQRHAPAALLALTLAGCAGDARPAASPGAQPADPYPGVNTVAQDRDLWQQLLADHEKIRRTVVYTPTGVEATTESDDPQVSARIIEHAQAMQARVRTGAVVRIWDPVFAELFKKHGAVRLTITTTPRGVTIAETGDDPEAVALLWSHAAGVSEFVREGPDAGGRATARIPAGSPPPPELAIGGVKHRFLLSQPDAAQIAALKAEGVGTLMNFRKPAETPGFDESAMAADAGVAYCAFPYAGAAELTDELLDSTRAAIGQIDAKGGAAAMHCRTGNRVGPGWAVYRTLDRGVPVEQAMAEARAVRLVDPLMESKARDYIRRRASATAKTDGWSPVEPGAMTHAQVSQKERAISARDQLFNRLMAELTQALANDGPAGAIPVCKERAPQIARTVAGEQGVMIGRTGERLRNPANAAPAWAAALTVETGTGFPSPRFAANTDGSMGAVLPIKLASTCVACHGEADRLDPAVKSALTAAYPKDRATGFKEGDLRGWFWVEVPPSAGH
jgi:uncharacterized protein (TIGR01244 family)